MKGKLAKYIEVERKKESTVVVLVQRQTGL